MMNAETVQFLLTTLMELATLLCAYGAVRLYKKKWQPRMVLLLVPLLINAVCYAVYRTTVFFYLGVILLLCIPFVWPRKSA
ncbi:hypothetical protein SAMN06298211_102140 [Prevotellaceae bacterium MN60]|jgi:hypothetical protein|nr:hypothetical protein SAMN06298211_102140 [Prevotellaceae bacterium MN60]